MEKYIYLMYFVQITAATDRINALREEQEQLKQENANILQSSQRKEEVRVAIEMLYYENNQYEIIFLNLHLFTGKVARKSLEHLMPGP